MDDLERGEEARKSPLVTATDHKVIIVVFLIIIVLLVGAFFLLRENARFQACQENINHIGKALGLYMTDNEGGLPPVFIPYGQGGVALDAQGRPRTWMIGALPYATDANIFTCPTASPDEYTHVSDSRPGKTGEILLTYGMFGLMGTANRANLEAFGSTILIAESTAGGRADSYDPLPLAGGNDGFLVGFNDSDSRRTAQARRLTRLAIRLDDPRHPKMNDVSARHSRRGLVVLYSGLSCGTLDAKDMFLTEAKPSLWASPER